MQDILNELCLEHLTHALRSNRITSRQELSCATLEQLRKMNVKLGEAKTILGFFVYSYNPSITKPDEPALVLLLGRNKLYPRYDLFKGLGFKSVASVLMISTEEAKEIGLDQNETLRLVKAQKQVIRSLGNNNDEAATTIVSSSVNNTEARGLSSLVHKLKHSGFSCRPTELSKKLPSKEARLQIVQQRLERCRKSTDEEMVDLHADVETCFHHILTTIGATKDEEASISLIVTDLQKKPATLKQSASYMVHHVVAAAASFVMPAQFNHYHLGISVGGVLIDWRNNSLVTPMPAAISFAMFSVKLASFDTKSIQEFETKLTRLCETIVLYNTTKNYSPTSTNCQVFATEALQNMGIDWRQAAPHPLVRQKLESLRFNMMHSSFTYDLPLQWDGISSGAAKLLKEVHDKVKGSKSNVDRFQFESHTELDNMIICLREHPAYEFLKDQVEGVEILAKCYDRAYWLQFSRDEEMDRCDFVDLSKPTANEYGCPFGNPFSKGRTLNNDSVLGKIQQFIKIVKDFDSGREQHIEEPPSGMIALTGLWGYVKSIFN